MSEVTIAIAVLAGLGSFVAPCILPMVPAFIAYISGSTVSELSGNNKTIVSINRVKVILNSIFFVLGFSIVFSFLGILINGFLSTGISEFVSILNYVGGIIIIGFGVFIVLSTKIRQLNMEKKFFPQGKNTSFPMSFLFGLAFAVGWTPCVGPVLGTVLTLAATTPSVAFNLLLAYSLGLGIPFILIGVFFSRATKIIQKMSKHLKYYSLILGGFIIILGILVMTNQLAYIANFPILNELVLWG
ncbi:cytochrome c biogenesis CcdA family protein [Nitrosopumilus ureiphilus]|uniref:Cytochrome C biogenesis protein n=1 Tax=Nitrosopumilus ureiphilus TaxID=1470067 RepID=A0A7D5M3K9_9ARCH|nr:cytochrome c biogenesis protein CcdA [Nitrosopumilus ureiphilus]QLH06306.1 cytochrome C biogenesis protein [Nitrosopumilus ureiphilus]